MAIRLNRDELSRLHCGPKKLFWLSKGPNWHVCSRSKGVSINHAESTKLRALRDKWKASAGNIWLTGHLMFMLAIDYKFHLSRSKYSTLRLSYKCFRTFQLSVNFTFLVWKKLLNTLKNNSCLMFAVYCLRSSLSYRNIVTEI